MSKAHNKIQTTRTHKNFLRIIHWACVRNWKGGRRAHQTRAMIYWIICKTYNLAKQSNLLTIGRLSFAGGSAIIIMGRWSREAYKPAAVKVLTSTIEKTKKRSPCVGIAAFSFVCRAFWNKHFIAALLRVFDNFRRRFREVAIFIADELRFRRMLKRTVVISFHFAVFDGSIFVMRSDYFGMV